MRAFVFAFVLLASGVSAQPSSCETDAARDATLERAPLLAQVASGDPEATFALQEYVCAYSPEALSSTSDLMRALTLRDSVISKLGRRVEGWFFTDDGDRFDELEAFYAEVGPLALAPVQAEGMLFDLTYGPLMDGIATVLAPADVMHYIDFITALGSGEGGEYPFGNMEAEVGMVLAGEQLRAQYPSSPYVASTQEAFSRALLDLVSLHPMRMEGMDELQWLAGVATTEFYPWAVYSEPLTEFVRLGTDSRYRAPLAAILASPPEADGGPLDVIVVGGAYDTRDDASPAHSPIWKPASMSSGRSMWTASGGSRTGTTRKGIDGSGRPTSAWRRWAYTATSCPSRPRCIERASGQGSHRRGRHRRDGGGLGSREGGPPGYCARAG